MGDDTRVSSSTNISLHQSLSKNAKNAYLYKNSVGIPALKMIDDVASVENCGVKSLVENTRINCEIEMKKLPLNKKKCKHLHVGTINNLCPKLKVHGETIHVDTQEKYLGDQIS